MGQRANLIIVENNSYDLYYNHWCANTLPIDLFWGPDHAREFIKIQKQVDENGWLDDVWAEGGAVLDLDRKVLLLYGGEDILYDIPLRRVYLKLLSIIWEEWEIKWAHEGIADIADYVKYPREKVLTTKNQSASKVSFDPPDKKEWVSSIASFSYGNGRISIFPLDRNIEDYIEFGEGIIEFIDISKSFDKVNLGEWTKCFPTGGFHIDMSNKILDYWVARDIPSLVDKSKKKWVGWEVNCNFDMYEKHIDILNGRLTFKDASIDKLIEELRRMLLRDYNNPVDTIVEVTNKAKDEGKDVKINPCALRNDMLEIPKNSREKILDIAIDKLMKK